MTAYGINIFAPEKTFTMHFHKTTKTITVRYHTIEEAAMRATTFEKYNPEWGYVSAIIEQ